MHELTRRAYLSSLGIDAYISRSQLPGAAPTRRLRVVRQDRIPARTQLDLSRPTPALPSDAVKPAKHVTEHRATVQSTSVPAFSIAAVAAGGWLWIEEIPQVGLLQDQCQLIRAMVRALGLNDGNFDLGQFDWPIHNNAQLDLGEEAARAGLGGFLQRKAGQTECRGLILLGSACQQRLDQKQLDIGQCVCTVSTRQMLRDGQLKKQAWLDLLPIARRS